MATLSDLTLEQLRAATVIQIRTALKNRIDLLSKRQLIRMLLALKGCDLDELVQVAESGPSLYRPDGQIRERTEVRRSELGDKLGGRRATWSYYETGEVDEITIVELDASGAETSRRTIKHFKDGRQPVVVES